MSGHGTAAEPKRRGGRAVQSRYLQCNRKSTENVSASSSSLCAAVPPSGAKAKSVLSQKRETSAGGRAVQSRYLQCDRKSTENVSASSFSLCAAGPPSGAKAKSVLSQKHETSAGVGYSLLSQSNFERGDLQSTLLDEENIKRPDLNLSPIDDKPVHRKSVSSESVGKGDEQTTKPRAVETDSNDQIEELESETLLFTYLRLKVEKNVAELEKKAEKNLIMLLKEKQRQQEKLWKLKREILVQEWKQKLKETLDKQNEVLSPLVPVCERLKEQYKSFAASLDATRHELPIKNIHIEGDKQTYLEKLGKELRITQELLTEIMPSHSEECAKALPALKELKEVYQKLNKELQRSFTEVQNLSSQVSKEVSLHNQSVCEEKHGLDVVKRWYFN